MRDNSIYIYAEIKINCLGFSSIFIQKELHLMHCQSLPANRYHLQKLHQNLNLCRQNNLLQMNDDRRDAIYKMVDPHRYQYDEELRQSYSILYLLHQ